MAPLGSAVSNGAYRVARLWECESCGDITTSNSRASIRPNPPVSLQQFKEAVLVAAVMYVSRLTCLVFYLAVHLPFDIHGNQ